MRPTHSGYARPLTPLERAILQQIANGRRVKQVARDREVCVETVRERLRDIRMKLGGGTTLHAVAIALRSGLIS